ncbi:hypothetical protein TNCV_4704171 [Trichonephila clavipes]|nr:hypothetical protein TNCV_4704171 [Trichonephila clavipes]
MSKDIQVVPTFVYGPRTSRSRKTSRYTDTDSFICNLKCDDIQGVKGFLEHRSMLGDVVDKGIGGNRAALSESVKMSLPAEDDTELKGKFSFMGNMCKAQFSHKHSPSMNSEAWKTKAEMGRLNGIRLLDYKRENLENKNKQEIIVEESSKEGTGP